MTARTTAVVLALAFIIVGAATTQADEFHEQQIDMARHAPPEVSGWPEPQVTIDSATYHVTAGGRVRMSREHWCRLNAADGVGDC